ncbi:MAG: peptidylprolyl isomerase [Bacteroidota bacterium]
MKKILFLIANVLILSACGNKNKDYLVTIKTSMGDMKVLLYEETPLHKENFLKLARSGRFDSTIFHRVISEFMVQGGDIYQKEGTQEPANARIPAEFVKSLYHRKGELAAARQGDQVNPKKQSSSCQFYIVQGKVWTEAELTIDQYKLNQAMSAMLQKSEYDSLRAAFLQMQTARDFDRMSELALNYKDEVEEVMQVELDKEFDPERLEAYTTVGGTPHLDDDYTVFGRVVEGLEVVDKIAAVKTAAANKPVENIYMTMEVEQVKKKEITKKYGYEYPDTK